MFKFNLYFKIVCSVILLLSLLVISSCVEQKKVSELHVESECEGAVCILGVVDKDFLKTRNILNQTQYTLLKTTPLKSSDSEDDGTHLLWSSKEGALATQEELTNVGLGTKYPCPDGKCTVTSNPTGFVADHLGINTGHVKGYVTNPDGQKEYINKDVSLNITVKPYKAEIKKKPLVSSSGGLTYELYIGTGIPLDSTYEWYIDGDPVPQDLISKDDGSFIHTFKFKGPDLYEGYKIKVVITLNDKSIEPIILTSTIIPKPASISSKQEKGLLYTFTANRTNTGLPKDGVTYNWSVNNNPIGTGSSIAYLFAKANTQYTIGLETLVNGTKVGDATPVKITTGAVKNPTLSAKQDGANPLAYTVTADESATNIGSDWSRVWSIDGKVVSGASTAKLDYTFGLTDHKYAVEYVASKEGYPDRTASIDVTTKGATKPTVTATASQDNRLSYAVKADLTNTGITDAWSYGWTSKPSATFADSTKATTDVEFASGGVGYTITFTATPPEGSTDVAQTGTTKVTTGQLAAKITAKQEKGLLYSLSADTSNTGLPDTGVTYGWTVDGNDLDSTGSSIDYLFAKANTKYTVILSTKIGDNVIGTNSTTVATGKVINPTLSVKQDGANPLAYTVTAEESATNIGSDWSRVWSIDGKAVEGASTAKLDHTFDLTDHKYTVSYVASKEGYPDRTASIDVTTKGATKPTVTATASQDNRLSYAVKADLTNTGITDAWSYGWTSKPSATFADSTKATTEVEFASGGVAYTITFTATPPEGSTDVAQTGTTTVTTGQLAAKITSKQEKGLLYSFTADTSNTGLPDTGVTYGWTVDGNDLDSTGSSIDYLFAKANTKYTVILSTKIGDNVIGTNSTTVATGKVINPTLSVKQDGANPLAYTVTAEESATNIGSDWSRVWSIDGKVVDGASTAKLDHTFDLTDHKYTVSYVASKEGYPDRTASIDVTTKGATKPTVTATASQDNRLSYAVKADLTNTGITDAWSYAWSSSPAASFKDATAATTDVEFASGGVGYTITFTATPPEGSTDVAQTGTTTVTTGQLAAKITTKQTKGLLYSFTADTSNTGLPSEGVTYAWSVNGKVIGSGSSIAYLFAKANKKYTVSLETKIGAKVIGTNSVAVTTGDVINPSLTATQDGANPLAYTVTAATTGTNIGSGWTYKWSGGDGVTFTTATGTISSAGDSVSTGVDFALTDHKYTVSYVASKEGYDDRTASIDVTTKGATKPTVTATASQDNPLSYAVNADLTNTGITAAWSYAWSSTPEGTGTFKDATVASTEVEFGKGGVYTISFTATPPEGSSDKAQTATETITTMLPARITYKKVNGTKYEFSANTSGTGLPNEGVTYEWKLFNRWSLGTGSSIDFLFNSAHTTYRVKLTTKFGNITIGTTQAYVTTGDAVLPKVTAIKDGSNPLVWTVKADVGGTNVNDDWTRQWYIDGKAVKGATNTYTLDSYEFALTDHEYKVEFAATNTLPDGVTTDPVTRSATITVITGAATAPKLSSSAGSSYLNFNVKADLTDTGITASNWDYKWTSSPSATFADDTATDTSVDFTDYGTTYTLTFTATPKSGSGSTDEPQSDTLDITTTMLPATIDDVADTGTKHTLTANTTGKGLPSSGVIYTWQVNGNNIGIGSSIEYIFPEANTTYNVSLETKLADGTVVGTETKDITTNNAAQPTLTSTQVGNNPLKWEITANTSNTNIGDDWSRKWYIDNSNTAIPGETGNVLTYTFALTKKDYTVKFEATSPDGGVVRTNSIAVTTGDATAPKLSSSAGSSYLNFNVKADLTDTGITASNWDYKWTSSPSATFADDTATDTSVDFTDYGTTYTLTFTATPKSGSGSTDEPQSDTLDITTTMLPATIDDVADTGTKHTLTANTTGKGLPSSGVIYTWQVNGNNIGIGSSIEYIFPEANTTYNVSLETKLADGTVVGTETKDITTNNAAQPTLTSTQVGNNPLKWEITANTSNTNIGDDWSRKWYIDNSNTAIPGETGNVLTYTFALTKKDYTVKFEATSPDGGVVRTNSIAVTTGDATAPKLSSSAGSSYLNFNVKADLTDTGITASNWDYKWTSSPSATFADDTATDTSVDFTDYGTTYTLTFTATPKSGSGSTDEPQSDTLDITTTMLPATIDDVADTGTKHTLTANTTGKGLPSSGVIYTWQVNGNNIGIGSSIEYIFPEANTTYNVSLETKLADGTVVGTETKDITTNNAAQPTLTSTQVGNNPLKWEITANTSNTNIGDDWSRKWYIDNSNTAIPGETGNVLTYTFALTKKDYTVKFEATSPDGGVVRTNSIAVTTGDATAPKLSSSAGSSYLNFNVKADLTDTGITDAWSYRWTSSPSATFADDTATDTSVDFTDYGTTYTLTFTATPPEGSSDKAQTGTTTVTTDQLLGASISSKQAKGLLYSFTANRTNTGLPSEGVVYNWSVNNNPIGTGSSIAYLFAKANMKYTVSLETKIGAKVIGTKSVAVTTGDVINPTLTATQDGANPLAYTVTADESATNIGADWSRVWSIDGKVVAVNTKTLHYTFGLTFHTYTVKYVASKAGYDSREVTTGITTKAATKPTLTARRINTKMFVIYELAADLTNTGITAAWSYKWNMKVISSSLGSDVPGWFVQGDTAATVRVQLYLGLTDLVTFTATPPAGSSAKAITATLILTTPPPPPRHYNI